MFYLRILNNYGKFAKSQSDISVHESQLMYRKEKTNILHIRRLLRFAFDVLKSGKFHCSLSKTKQRGAPMVLYIQPFWAVTFFLWTGLQNGIIIYCTSWGFRCLLRQTGNFRSLNTWSKHQDGLHAFIIQLCEPYYKEMICQGSQQKNTIVADDNRISIPIH